MTAAVPLIAEALNLAITEHWGELIQLRCDNRIAAFASGAGLPPARHEDRFSAGIESLAVALHARLQEQGALT